MDTVTDKVSVSSFRIALKSFTGLVPICLFIFMIMTIALSGCGGNKSVTPSPDSLLTTDALITLEAIRTAYEEKDSDKLRTHLAPLMAADIADHLPVETARLTITPRIVTIKESTVVINSGWQGAWSGAGRVTATRGSADFVLDKESLKLLDVHGDNPLRFPRIYTLPSDWQRGQAGSLSRRRDETMQKIVKGRKSPKTVQGVQQESNDAGEERTSPASSMSEKNNGTGIIIQVGAWKVGRYAQAMLSRLQDDYPRVYLVVEETNDTVFHKVRIPGMTSRQEGLAAAKRIEQRFGVKPIVLHIK